MGLRMPGMPYMAPGIENPLLAAAGDRTDFEEQWLADPERRAVLSRLRQAARRCRPLSIALLAAALGAGCTYPDDELVWGNCCALKVSEEASSSTNRGTLLFWGATVGFQGDGSSEDWDGTKAWRKGEIALRFAQFRQMHADTQARDYLVGLGMTCGDERAAKPGRTRCTVELSVWARCVGKVSMLFPSPVPSGLRKLDRRHPPADHRRIGIGHPRLVRSGGAASRRSVVSTAMIAIGAAHAVPAREPLARS